MQQQSEYRTIDRLQVRSDDVDVVFDVKSDGRSFGEFDLWEMIEAFAYFNTPAQEEFWDTSKTIAELAEGGMYAEQLKNELGIVISPITTDIELNGLETFLTEGYEPPTGIVYKLYLYDDHPEPAPKPAPVSTQATNPFADLPDNVTYLVTKNGEFYNMGYQIGPDSHHGIKFSWNSGAWTPTIQLAAEHCLQMLRKHIESNAVASDGRSLKRILAEEDDD